MAFNFILMLTENDRTIPDAPERLEPVSYTHLTLPTILLV